MLRIADHASKTDVGRQRHTNEDNFYDQPPVFAVADGMGGHNAGEVASKMTVDAVGEFVSQWASADSGDTGDPDLDKTWPFGYDTHLTKDGNLLRTAVQIANVQILEAASHSEEYAGMGTTIVAARPTRASASVYDRTMAAALHAAELQLPESWLPFVVAR